MNELELKFRVPDAVLSSLHAALLVHGATRQRLQARYFDTADGLLARNKVALRLRLEGSRWVQTLKAAGDGVVHRLEHEVFVGDANGKLPTLALHLHDGSEAGQLLDVALATSPGAVLAERHATDIERLHCMLNGTDVTQIEAALDIGSVEAGGRAVPIAELELEHKAGPVQGLFDLAAILQSHGGLWLCSISKAERGERLLQRDAEPIALKARAPQLDAAADGPGLLRVLLQSTMEQVVVNASEVAEGSTAIETVHQLRIGLRRLRTVLRELALLSPSIERHWEGELAGLFAILGQARDQEAVAAAVRPLLVAAQAPLLMWQAPPSPDLAAAVRETGFQTTLIEILALAHGDRNRFSPLEPEAAKKLVAASLDALHRRVTRDGRRFDKLPLPEQHRVRKRLKRLRYLAEMTGSLWPKGALRSYLKHLAKAQESLGRHNDIAVAVDAFRDDASAHPDAWFAVGFLQAQLPKMARRARKALGEVANAGKGWT